MRNGVVRFGVLGTGRITRKVGPAIARTPGAELAAVASRDGDRAAAWAREFGAVRGYGSYDALLDDGGLDAVYVALPPSLHREWTVKAAARGLHVLCEKPLAVTAAEAAEMVAACRAANVQLMDGVMWVHTPRAAAMREVLRSGALGPIRRVTSAMSFHPDEWTPDQHRLHADLGGGALLDLGWYCVGVSLWAFAAARGGEGASGRVGEGASGHLPPSPSPALPLPAAVRATASWRNGVDVALSALLNFGDGGPTAGFDCGFDTAMRKWVEVAGAEGSLVCDDFARARSPEKTRFWLHGRWAEAEVRACEPSVQEEDLIAAFCRPLLAGVPEHHWAEASLRVQQVCDALLTAARTGATVMMRPDF